MPSTKVGRQKRAEEKLAMTEIRLLGDATQYPDALQANIANQKAKIAINRLNRIVYGDKKSK